jgi:hypothetical protein
VSWGVLGMGVAGGDAWGATSVAVMGVMSGLVGANDESEDVTVTVVVGATGGTVRAFDADENVNVTAAVRAAGISQESIVWNGRCFICSPRVFRSCCCRKPGSCHSTSCARWRATYSPLTQRTLPLKLRHVLLCVPAFGVPCPSRIREQLTDVKGTS